MSSPKKWEETDLSQDFRIYNEPELLKKLVGYSMTQGNDNETNFPLVLTIGHVQN